MNLLERGGTLGVWSPDVFDRVLTDAVEASAHLSQAESDKELAPQGMPALKPAELIVLAHIAALENSPTLRGAAAELFVDARTLRERLVLIAANRWFVGPESQRHLKLESVVSRELAVRLEREASARLSAWSSRRRRPQR